MNYPEYPFTCWYQMPNSKEILWASSISQIPEDDNILITDVYQIHSLLQGIGCCGLSGHDNNPLITGDWSVFALKVLPLAIEKHGEIFPVVYRGISGDLPDNQHRYLFGSLDKEVAAFYGEVQEYRNIKGLHFRSTVKSVKTGDYDDGDSEVIFLPKK